VLLLAGASGQAGLPWISRLLGRELTLARTGHAEYAIVCGASPTEAEQYAAQELADFLGQIGGATFTIGAESQAAGDGGKLYVGWTEFASRHGIDSRSLGRLAELTIEP
jgi:hypothetical protein